MARLSHLHFPASASRYVIMLALGSALAACASADARQELIQISTPEASRPAAQEPTAAPAPVRQDDPESDDQEDDVSDDATIPTMAEPEPLPDEIGTASAAPAINGEASPEIRSREGGRSDRMATSHDETPEVSSDAVNYAGSWTAISSGGRSCRATLSMAKAGNARRASTSGCAGDGMSQVSAWDLRGDTIVLMGSGGAPVARFEAAPRAMSGTLAGSGDRVTMSR